MNDNQIKHFYVGWACFDANGTVASINGAFERFVGKSRADVVGNHIGDILPDAPIFRDEDQFQQIFSNVDKQFSWYGSCLIDSSKTVKYTLQFLGGDDRQNAVLRVFEVTRLVEKFKNLKDGETLYRQLVNFSPDPVILHDQGHILFCNPATSRLLLGADHAPEELTGEFLPNFYAPEFLSLGKQRLGELMERGQLDPVEMVLCPRFGKDITVEAQAQLVKYDGKDLILSVWRNIDERKSVEARLRASEERYALAAMGANDGLWDWQQKSDEVYFSTRCAEMLGYPPDQFCKSVEEFMDLIHASDVSDLKEQIVDHLHGQVPRIEMEVRMRNHSGGYRWILMRGMAAECENGRATRVTGSLSDISNRKRAEQQLAHNAAHDPLTGLRNRAIFLDRLEAAYREIKRGNNAGCAVAVLNLDRFNRVNDSLGHTLGDALLMSVAHRLEQVLGPNQMLARTGADEFAVLIENSGEIAQTREIARRLLNTFNEPFDLVGRKIVSSASLGIAVSSIGVRDGEDVLRNAILAMFRAKQISRGGIEIFDQTMHAEAMRALEIETALRETANGEQLFLEYQPIVDSLTSDVVSFEALVRWQHPEKGFMPPGEFIPMAEDTGLIVPIGRWVFAESCRQMKYWDEQFGASAPRWVSINVSGVQLSSPEFLEDVRDILDETGISGDRLRVEITETVFMESPQATRAVLEGLRDLGIKLCIDDFGTGYSSFAYLTRFPVDVLKIDRSFIMNLRQEGEEYQIVHAIVALAQALKISVVAEGVETAEQLQALRHLQVDYCQGFYFSRPRPAEIALEGLQTAS